MNRKFYSFLLAFSLLSTFLFAEKYNVIHVKGEIRLEKTKTKLKPGDVIDEEDKVIFGSADALAALFSPSRGRFTLSPEKKSADFGEEFIAYVKSSLVPARKGLSTRDAGSLNSHDDLYKHFSKEKYLILGTSKVEVNPKKYPLSQTSFFFLRMEVGDEQVNKMLPFDGKKIVLSANHILQVDTKPINPEDVTSWRLFYYQTETTVSTMICDFDPVFPDEEQLKEELTLLKSSMEAEGADEDQIKQEILGFVQEYFGNPTPENLHEWMELNL